jgi:hypothetical protein
MLGSNTDELTPKTPMHNPIKDGKNIMFVNRAEKILIDSISDYCDKLKVSGYEFSNFFKEEQLILKSEVVYEFCW